MDEAEKYKQRLEAIAEKRRLQEEQDKARREMEDEKLRQQQLKRKSLRDQWLMEGAPMSPTSPNTKNLLSSLWDSQDTEKPGDKLQAENQQLSEELQEQQKAVKTLHPAAEKVPALLQNGENKATEPETSGVEVTFVQTPPEVETAAALTNGEGDVEPNTPEQNKLNPNGLDRVTEGVDRTESASAPNASVNEEGVEEGILVMRAEPVFITDDGPEEDQQESDQTPLSHPENGNEMGEDTEQVVTTEPVPGSLTEPENNEATREAHKPTGGEDEEEEGEVKLNKIIEAEMMAEDQEKVEDLVVDQLQSPADAVEGAAVALVPVYSEASPAALSPQPEVQIKDEASAAPDEEERERKVEDPVRQSGSFQEVSLAEPQENQRTTMEPREQEPLLVKAKASYVYDESAGSNGPSHAETQNPPRTSQGDETGSPKRKTCQCCSVM
uniref:Paralemmin 3 n=1 Tax=Nothobranchius kadleci TaxID=1051664 RepID=A0A1A8E5G1_NOTKA